MDRFEVRVLRRFGAVFALVVLLAGAFTFGTSAAAPLSSGSVGGFEDDGNMAVDANPGTIDWASVTSTVVKATDDTLDSGYVGTSKENEPEGFVCNTGGDDPKKANLLRAYVNTRVYGPPQQDPPTAYLDLGFVREDGGGTGDAHVNFEFNQHEITNPCPFTGRTDGDLLITFDFPGGTGTASIQTFKWDATAGADGLGNWIEFTLPDGAAAGLTNSAAIQDVLNGNSALGAREFGEATVDLVALNDAAGGDLLTCPGFGYVNIRSRSSGESFESALQDRMPQTPVDLSTCGSLKIKKVDDKGAALAGATFGLFDNADATGTPAYTCTSIADGTCSISGIVPGDYWIKETAAPTGYSPDPDIVPVTIGFRQAVDLTASPFVDPRQTGYVRIVKVLHDQTGATITPSSLSVLDGTTFLVYTDKNNDGAYQAGEEAKLWSNGQNATCTISGGTGRCDVGPLATGAYRITETVLPPNTSSAGDVNVTVVAGTAATPVSVNYVNVLSPLNITLEKAGPNTANVGDVITYTFDVSTTGPRLHSITVTELVDVCTGDPTYVSGDDGDSFLEVGETWHYTCQHTVTMSDSDPLLNTARATGTDDYGRTVSDDDGHSVDILYPDVTITKDAVDDSISAGDQAQFTITVTVGGENGSIARNVTVSDTLPAGLTWTENSASCSIASGSLSCSFGDLAKGATRSVTLTAQTNGTSCGDIPNTATVAATNDSNTTNNSDSATIHVSCPDVSVLKTADVTPINAGDTAAFTIVVTNNDATGTATNVTLTDTLPSGISWAINPSVAGCSITSGVLSCSFGDLGPSATRTVHISGVTDPADCGVVPNTAVVASTNEGAGLTANNSSTASITVRCPDVAVLKTADDSSVSAGDAVGFTMTVSNAGPGIARSVTLSDPLPSGVTWTISPSVTGCSITSGVLSCNLGDLAAGASVQIHVTGTTDAADCGTLTNTATVAATNEGSNVLANNTSTATITVSCPNIGIRKTADAGTVSAGSQVGFTITLSNSGPGVAYGATIDDSLPADAGLSWTIASTDPAAADCTITAGNLQCNAGDLAVGGSLSVHITSPTTAATCGDFTNTAVGDATNDDPVQSSDSITVLCPGLNFTKSPDNGIVDAGSPISFTLTASNVGPGDAHDVVIDDDLPAGFAWSVTDERCDITAGHLHCDLGTLAAPGEGQTATTVAVVVTAPTDATDCGLVDNTGTADASNDDPISDDGHVRVRCPLDITIDKTGPAQAHVGDTITYTMVVTNTGGEDLVTVALTDPICAAGSLQRTNDGDGDSVLAVGESWTYTCTHVVTASDPDPLPNVASVIGTDIDGRTTGDDDDHLVDILHPAINIVKTANPVSASPGDTVTFTYDVTNTGDTTLFGVTVVDDKLGPIGTITELAPGQTVTLKKTMVVAANSPTTNVGTAAGTDVLGQKVTDDDDAVITIVLPEVIERTPLARTGAESRMLVLFGMTFLLGGATVLVIRRRWLV